MLSRTSTAFLKSLLDNRNDRAWRRFYHRYTPMLLSYARSAGLCDADVQEAVAATLATAAESFRKYDRDRARLKSWLGGIIQNKIRKILARRRIQTLSEGERSPSIEPAAPDDLDEVFEREWQRQRLSEGIEILRREVDPDTYQAFDLYALKGWPVDKVASFMDMTNNAVYINKTRCLARLRQIIEKLVEQE